jgi:hypothetical protein
MKTSLLASCAVATLILTGCSVMHFQNGQVEPAGRLHEQWHHNVAYSLYEVSKPLDMKALCPENGGKWSMVTTKETFITGLAGQADDVITAGLLKGAGGVDLWDPQMVEYTCGK